MRCSYCCNHYLAAGFRLGFLLFFCEELFKVHRDKGERLSHLAVSIVGHENMTYKRGQRGLSYGAAAVGTVPLAAGGFWGLGIQQALQFPHTVQKAGCERPVCVQSEPQQNSGPGSALRIRFVVVCATRPRPASLSLPPTRWNAAMLRHHAALRRSCWSGDE